MDLEYVKELIALLEKSKMQRITIKEKNGTEIMLDKGSLDYQAPSPTPNPTARHNQTIPAAPITQPLMPEASESGVDKSMCVTSPMVGTCYLAASPDQPIFVKVGDSVKKGDTICIIEAMKVMNEITSDRSGIIKQILVNDGDPVEYGLPLFEIE